MKNILMLLALCAACVSCKTVPPPPPDWSGAAKADQWHGFERRWFKVDGCDAWVALPPKAAPGNPWVWCMEFPEAFDTRTGAVPLVQGGFSYLYINVGDTFGAPSAQKHLDAFYDWFTARGLAKKGACIGISRGGLYMYGFARRHPERVACLYGDAPVCDFKSWPGGKFHGAGSPSEWQSLIKTYGFKDEAEAMAYKLNPVDALEPIAAAGIPIIHVVGDADTDVPPAENSDILISRYKALAEKHSSQPPAVAVFRKPGCAHHPHGLDDPTPVVDFIRSCCK
jgi:hypothetical protein